MKIRLSDLVVAACRRDSTMLKLELESPNETWTIIVEGAFSASRETDADGETDAKDVLSSPPTLDVVGASVSLIRARKSDGELEMKLGHDWTVTVEPHNDYEAWQMYSSNGDRLIAVPGDGIAVWTGES